MLNVQTTHSTFNIEHSTFNIQELQFPSQPSHTSSLFVVAILEEPAAFGAGGLVGDLHHRLVLGFTAAPGEVGVLGQLLIRDLAALVVVAVARLRIAPALVKVAV